MEKYDPKKIEKKWQDRWEEAGAFHAEEKGGKQKYYVLDMFPYPSAQGLHVGHPEGYTATDIIARKRRMEGFNVLHPFGWDSFGLPAENYAIKVGGHPEKITNENIENFTRQIKSLGFSYDWSREVKTSSPDYYKWTQWLFLVLYKNGLAYKRKAPVNWCESCKTVLANEQVVDGRCERCKNEVMQKDLEQWFFRITEYADRLLEGLDDIDWPERIKAMQRNWIGRSEGVEIEFRGQSSGDRKEFSIPVFTTRPDTLFGVMAIVLAPEHPLADRVTTDHEREQVMAYVKDAQGKSELERTGAGEKEKTGIFTGAYARHPLTGTDVPIYIADYALMGYGTGAVMVVPAHDQRDFEFAKKYGLDVKWVVAPPSGASHDKESAYTEPGVMVNSGAFDGLTSEDAKQKIADELESQKKGSRQTHYHLRDWLVSRQRYWGAPIPIIYCDVCGESLVPEKDLPVLLPDDVDFKPTGESPLTQSKTFHDVKCPKCDAPAKRESDTMDTFVDSSWYFLRYTDANNSAAFADREKIDYWCPIDMYVGGAEHAVLHLLYSRFFTKALKDAGYLDFDEPFTRLRNQGMILGEDNEKMSKSRGNVINPDEVVEKHGADTLRLYEMFMGEFSETKPWSMKSIIGLRRFIEKVWKFAHASVSSSGSTGGSTKKLLHKTIKKVSEDIEAFKFNTAVSAMMIFVNDAETVSKKDWDSFLKLLAPFAPHVSEELWELNGHDESLTYAAWPKYDEALVVDEVVTIVVQVNGKVKDRLQMPKDSGEDDLKAKALASDHVKKATEGKEITKVVVVRNRLVNVVLQ